MKERLKTKIHDLLILNPWVMTGGIALGILIGIVAKPVAQQLKPWGDLYLAFIKMTILPLVVTAIISSVAAFVHSEQISWFLKKAIPAFLIGVVVVSASGMLFAAIFQPGNRLSTEDEVALGRFISQAEAGGTEFFSEKEILERSPTEVEQPHLFSFIINLIPENVFASLVNEEFGKVVFFSLIFGIALGMLPSHHGDPLINSISGLYKTFEKIILWAMILLPIGMGSYIAGEVTKMGGNLFFAMLPYLGLIYAGTFVILLIDTVVIAKSTNCSLLDSMRALKTTFFVSIGSQSEFVAMPFALKEIQEHLKVDRNLANLLLPLGFTIFSFGAMFNFAFTAICFIQIHDVSLGILGLFVVLFGAIIASIASSSTPGMAALGMYSIIFTPLSIPTHPSSVLLLGLAPLVNFTIILITVYTNCALVCFIGRKKEAIARLNIIEQEEKNILT